MIFGKGKKSVSLQPEIDKVMIKRITPRWIIMLIDLLICMLSLLLSYCLRFDFRISNISEPYITFPLVFIVCCVVFWATKMYVGIVRYTGAHDIMRVSVAVATTCAILIIANFISGFITSHYLIPMSVILIFFFLATFLLVFSRLFIKNVIFEIGSNKNGCSNVLIYGSSELSLMAKNIFDSNKSDRYKVVGFIDHHPKVIGKKIDGVRIYHLRELSDLIKEKDISVLVFNAKGISVARKKQLVDICLQNKVEVKTIPEATALLKGDFNVRQLRNVRIEDLLERSEIHINKDKIRKNLINKVILVTGAAGSIGSEIVRQLTSFMPKKIILFDIAESPLYDIELEIRERYHFTDIEVVIGDIRNDDLVEDVFSAYRPSYVFHAAAYKHVPMMELHPSEALSTNIKGTKIIADAAVRHEVSKFVMISTDKAVNPTNVMGASKRIAEIYIQSLSKSSATKFITTRFGNVLGSNGSVIPRFKKQIENGGPVTITDPRVTRFFMTIPEACQLVLEAGCMGNGGEIFMFNMGEPIKIIHLAQRMISLSGLRPGEDIKIAITGLRPGEKLYEELLANKEENLPTYHSQIMIAKVREYDPKVVGERINALLTLEHEHDNFVIVKAMKDIVPEYKSKNSMFEVLDDEAAEEGGR